MRARQGVREASEGDRSESTEPIASCNRLLSVLAAAFAACLLLVATAQAEVPYKLAREISDPSMTFPRDVAVDQETHHFYVADYLQFNPSFEAHYILRFDAEGDLLSPATMGSGLYTSVAVNPQSPHDVYGVAGNLSTSLEELNAFTAAGASIPGGTFVTNDAETAGSSIATDSAGHIYVYDSRHRPKTVTKVDATGAPVSAFGTNGVIDCSDCPSPARFDGGGGVAVDSSGNVYVGSQKGELSELQAVTLSEGASGGSFTLTFEGQTTAPIAYNATEDEVESALEALSTIGPGNVNVNQEGAVPSKVSNVLSFNGSLEHTDVEQVSADDSALVGATVSVETRTPGGTSPGRVLKFNSSGVFQSVLYSGGTQVSVGADPSSEDVFVETDEGGLAHVLGFDASGTQFTEFGEGVLQAAGGPSNTGIGLDSSTGTVYVTDLHNVGEPTVDVFTPPLAPVTTTEAASNIAQTTATLNGKVDAEGSEAGCEFEYGTTTAYGKVAPCTPAKVSGSNPTAVKAALSGLTANTTYHYRVVAENEAGPAEGSDMTFTTAAETCATNAALCPPPPPPSSGGGTTPPPAGSGTTPPPPAAPKPLTCKKGFKKKKVHGKFRCVKLKHKHHKHHKKH
jgi:hypothetical protein